MQKHWRSGTPIMFDGIHFRATGEAMWYAFFRELGLNVHYEPDKFEMRNGLYIPDLWISDWDLRIEIKPLLRWADRSRYEEFAQTRYQCFLLLVGKPGVGRYNAFAYRRGGRALEYAKFAEVANRHGGIGISNANGESLPLAWNIGVREAAGVIVESRKIRNAFERAAMPFETARKPSKGVSAAPRVFRKKEHISLWSNSEIVSDAE
jgi:hypothetical protein